MQSFSLHLNLDPSHWTVREGLSQELRSEGKSQVMIWAFQRTGRSESGESSVAL